MSAIEITAVRALPPAGPDVRAFAIDTPTGGETSESDGFVLSGWALGHIEPIQTVTVAIADRTLTDLSVDGRRPDVAAAHPDAPRAGQSGFQGWVPTVGLPSSFTLELSAVTGSGQAAAIGVVTGRRWRSDTAPSRSDDRARSSRPVPEFFILGAQRGGTRALYEDLARHPRIQPARTDEVHYFSLFFDRGLRWYQSQFPALASGQITGEASPYYLFHPLAPKRLHAVAPDAKLIVLLRNPVDRAYSHYQHEVRLGTEPLSFEAAIAAESERLAGEEARILDDDTYISFTHQHYSYLARGRYLEQLRRWLPLFPPEQILVIQSEAYYRDPGAIAQQATDFLGLEPHSLASVPVVADAPYPSMAPETRRRLDADFAVWNAGLTDLVGRELSWEDQ
jgi:hypothetical protein